LRFIKPSVLASWNLLTLLSRVTARYMEYLYQEEISKSQPEFIDGT